MERQEAAKAARQELGAFLDRLKEEAGIERRQIAELLGVPPPTLSRMAADEVKDRPTFAPPPAWKADLAPRLRELARKVVAAADSLTMKEP